MISDWAFLHHRQICITVLYKFWSYRAIAGCDSVNTKAVPTPGLALPLLSIFYPGYSFKTILVLARATRRLLFRIAKNSKSEKKVSSFGCAHF